MHITQSPAGRPRLRLISLHAKTTTLMTSSYLIYSFLITYTYIKSTENCININYLALFFWALLAIFGFTKDGLRGGGTLRGREGGVKRP